VNRQSQGKAVLPAMMARLLLEILVASMAAGAARRE
jgi:hypothetical protein